MKTVIILAAGAGTKIWPYNSMRNKTALPIANKPNIAWQVEMLRKNGFDNIVVVVGYRKEQIFSALAGFQNIQFIEQKKEKGNVAALLSAWKGIDDQKIAVLYGDVLFTEEDLYHFLQTQNKKKALCHVLVQQLHKERPQDWMCAQIKNETISHILAHPRDGVTHRICGFFLFDKKFKSYLESNFGWMQSVQVGMMPSDEAHIEDSIQIAIEKGEIVQAVEVNNFYCDLDKPWHYLEANFHWNEYVCNKINKSIIAKGAKISDGADISGKILVGENSIIGKGAIIEGNMIVGKNTKIVQGAIVDQNVTIGSRCTIQRYCQIEKCSSISDECFIGHGAEVAGIFLRRAYSYHYGEFWGILGENGDLGAATVCGNLRFDDMENIHVIKERRENPLFGANAAYLGDFVRTGVNTIIMPGVKIGAYGVIGAGTVVQEDVPDKTLVYVQQQLVKKEWGPERYGW